jgi:hypothetical protein
LGGRGDDPRDYTDHGLERMYRRWQEAEDKHPVRGFD